MEKQIIEIVKQRDEFPLSIEISNDNAKKEPTLTFKFRSELDATIDVNAIKAKAKELRVLWIEESEKLALRKKDD